MMKQLLGTLLVAITAAAMVATPAWAVDVDWNVTTGDVSEPSNWSPAQVPTTDDMAYVRNGGTATIGEGNEFAGNLLGLMVGNTEGSYSHGNVNQTGGTVTTAGGRFQVGVGDGITLSTTLSTYTITGGAIDAGNYYSRIGYRRGYGKLDMSGASTYRTNSTLYVGDTQGVGILAMADTAQVTAKGGFRVGSGTGNTGTVTMTDSADVVMETGTGWSRFGGGQGTNVTVTLGTADTGDDHDASITLGGALEIANGIANAPEGVEDLCNATVNLYDHTSISAAGKVSVGVWNFSNGVVNLYDNSSFAVTGTNDLIVGDSNDGGGTYNVGPGNKGTITLNDSSTFTVGNWAVIGQFNQGNGTVEVKDNSTLTITGGARVGYRVGQGTLKLTSPTNAEDQVTVNIGTDLYIGQNGDSDTAQSKGYLYINEGTSLNVGDDFLVAEGDNAVGTVEMTGGSLTVGDWFVLSRTGPGSHATLTMSGDATATAGGLTMIGNGYSGTGSTATATLSGNASFTATSTDSGRNLVVAWGGTGVVTVGDGTAPETGDPGAVVRTNANIMLCNDPDDADATLNINIGGTVETPYIHTGPGKFATINFDGGLLRALGSDVPEVPEVPASGEEPAIPAVPAYPFLSNRALVTHPDFAPVLTLNVLEHGARIDTNGYDDTIAEGLVDGDGLGGGLTKLGDGTLTLGGANTYTGATLVDAGGLSVTGSITSDVTVADGAALLGTGTILGDVVAAAGSTVAPGTSIGTLTVNGDVAVSGALDIEYNSDTSEIDLLNVSGLLDLREATLSFSDLGTGELANGVYVFANYDCLLGTPTEPDPLPSGWSIDYMYNECGSIALVVVPEPSILALLAGLCVLLASCRTRR